MNLDALREKRKTIQEDMQWRKAYLEGTRAAQNRIERHAITSMIHGLAPGLQALYLRQRLAKLKARLE
jgi:hypothetical protein